MKAGETLTSERLHIRAWDKAADGGAFHRLNSDPQVMRFFPYRRSREESDGVLDVIARQVEDKGYGWSAICLRACGSVVGFGGIAPLEPPMPFAPGSEIGWRFLPSVWGRGYATEAAQAFLAHGFETLGLCDVHSFCVHDNGASEAVMKRIGMVRLCDADFDHPKVPDTHPHLKRHIVYRLTADHWRRSR